MAEEEPTRTIVVGAEGLGGPSWQEPAAVEVGADLDRRGTERDVPAAFLTGIVLAGVALVALADRRRASSRSSRVSSRLWPRASCTA